MRSTQEAAETRGGFEELLARAECVFAEEIGEAFDALDAAGHGPHGVPAAEPDPAGEDPLPEEFYCSGRWEHEEIGPNDGFAYPFRAHGARAFSDAFGTRPKAGSPLQLW